MKRFVKTVCIAMALCLLFTGLAFAEGDEGDAEQAEPAQQETQEEPAETGEDTVAEPPAQIVKPIRSDSSAYLWIGLAYGSGAVDKITIRSTEGFLIVKGNNKGWTETDIKTDSKTLTIVPSGGKAALIDENGTTLLSSLSGGGYFVLSAAENPEDRLITINGSRYRDGATATVYGSKLNVINVIEMEHYVRGVVANEMGYTYPIEALKAQAIAARSYAFRNIDKHRAYGIDLCTTQDCQVYRGYASEHDSTDQACAETKGKVMVSGGKVVEAYYYAYSGGATLNSEDVWINALDYCRGKVDEYYSDYLWAVHYTMDELTEEMVNRGKNIGNVVGIQVTKRHATGAVAEVTFIGTKGSAAVTKSTILSALGLKSFMFAINDQQFAWNKDGMATVTDASVTILGADATQSDVKNVTVIGADSTVDLSVSDLRISNGTTVAMPQGTVSAGWTDKVVNSDTVYIAGSGWGHGVGMPQTSARNMANKGFNCEDILKYYYEGITIGDLADYR